MADEAVEKLPQGELLQMTTDLVAAYLGNNAVSAAQIPDVIKSVYSSLTSLDGGVGASKQPAQKPAVSVKKSVTPDHIVCLEDGKKLKMLKRHLRTTYNLTPDEYRAKWGLPADYPMVAPNYAKQRSAFAKKIGLGRRARTAGRRGDEQQRKFVDGQRYAARIHFDAGQPGCARGDVGHRLVAGQADILDGDVGAHVLQDVDDAGPCRVHADIRYRDLGI